MFRLYCPHDCQEINQKNKKDFCFHNHTQFMLFVKPMLYVLGGINVKKIRETKYFLIIRI